jgi:hypothetical protein
LVDSFLVFHTATRFLVASQTTRAAPTTTTPAALRNADHSHRPGAGSVTCETVVTGPLVAFAPATDMTVGAAVRVAAGVRVDVAVTAGVGNGVEIAVAAAVYVGSGVYVGYGV